MAENAPYSADPLDGAAADERLDSWKEIAAYLKRDVTTVRRWEKREGLPVHRHLHERRDSVYAYKTEVDDWWRGRRNHLAQNGALDALIPSGEGAWPAPLAAAVPHRSEGHRGARTAWTLASIFLSTTLLLTALLFRDRPTRGGEAEIRLSLLPPSQTSFGTVRLSPDGRLVAFTASSSDGTTLLWIRPLDSVAARSLRDTDGAAFPFWSAESDAVGFFADGKLWIVDIAGGSPRVVADAPNGRGGTWNRAGDIVFAPGRDGQLFRVLASGGTATPVTTVNRPDERGHLWPEFLPDGEHFLYLADSTKPEHHHVFVGSLDAKAPKRLLNLASDVVFSEDYLFFARDRQLVAQPFDASRLALTGESVLLADHVFQQWDLDHKTDFSVSSNGVLIYRSLGGFDTQLVWRNRSEHQASALVSAPAGYATPMLSPDGTRVAVDVFDPRPSKRFGFNVSNITSDIWIVNASSGAASRFTTDPGAEFEPVWSPDGTRIAYSSNRRGGNLDLYLKNADGTGRDELLLASAVPKHAETWSPDGRFLVFATLEPKTRYDLWLLPMIGDRTPIPLLRTESSEGQVHISPDGRWFAYSSIDKSGRSEVYVQSFPLPGQKWQISTNGGGAPRWRADGRELLYIAEDRQLMAVAVKTGATFERGEEVPLFDTGMQPHWGTNRNLYDVSRDGQRFLFMTPVADDRSSPYTVVVNWMAGLQQQAR